MGVRFSYANVMSTLAVFLALAGGSFAIGAALSKNSVKSKQVKNEALTAKDLKNGKAVGAAEVIDESLGSADLGAGSVGSAEVAPGEPRHVVGGANEPILGNGGDGDCIWSDGRSFIPNVVPISFYKEVTGEVHVQGLAVSSNGPQGDAACDASGGQNELLEDFRVFTLPPGYRPDHLLEVSATVAAPTPAPNFVLVGADEDSAFTAGSSVPAGAVIIPATAPVTGGSIIDVSFRAAGAEPSSVGASARPAADGPINGAVGPLGR